jgi:hypothetical protein
VTEFVLFAHLLDTGARADESLVNQTVKHLCRSFYDRQVAGNSAVMASLSRPCFQPLGPVTQAGLVIVVLFLFFLFFVIILGLYI